jgi:hypothetical protein
MKPVSAMAFIYVREKPFREETSAGPPLIAPAWRMKRCLPPDFADSNCSRTSRPTGRPVRREVSLSQSRSSSVRRIVIVRLIRQSCNTCRYFFRPFGAWSLGRCPALTRWAAIFRRFVAALCDARSETQGPSASLGMTGLERRVSFNSRSLHFAVAFAPAPVGMTGLERA